MKILSLKQTSCRQTDVVFRNTSLGSAIGAVVMWALVGTAVYLLIYGRIGGFDPPRALVVFIGLFVLLFAWLMTRTFQAARRPSNWLVRLCGNEVLVKYRSYENWRMSEDDPQVIELHRDEIAAVRQRKERQVSKNSEGSTVVYHRGYLELELKNHDTSEIEKALAAEVALPGWGNEHHRTKSLSYPVSADNRVIRITWSSESSSIRPKLKQALAAFSRLAPVGETQTSTEDFTPASLRELPKAEQRKRLAELARRDSFAADRAARELYHCSLSEARKMIEELSAAGGPAPEES
jgi:hypothetical protein